MNKNIITKQEAELIIWEFESLFKSILHYKAREKKGDFSSNKIKKYSITDFGLSGMELTEAEFYTILIKKNIRKIERWRKVGLLEKCNKIIKLKDKTQPQKERKR
jgi:hypothetical protein